MAAPIPPTTSIPPLNDGPLQLTVTGFNPTVDDVLAARRILTDVVPVEIALIILSFATYHPRRSSIKRVNKRYEANEFWRPGPTASVAGLYLTVQGLSVPDDTVARAKCITFQMKAADQGWADNGGDGTYHNSHTWFEASILRPRSDAFMVTSLTLSDHMDNFPSPAEARAHLRGHGWDMVENSNDSSVVWRVHNNVTACREYRHYRVRWVAGISAKVDDPRAMGDGEGFLEILRPDDVVVLWARAEVCV